MSALGGLWAATFLLAALSGTPAHAQLSKGGTPPSQDASRNADLASSVPFVTMPKVDVEALRAEDTQNVGKAMPWRFGHNLAVDIGPATHGVWATMADGGRLWRVGIQSSDALTINLLFDKFHVPPGAELFVYSETSNHTIGHTIGAFTEANHQAAGSLATTLVRGDRVVVEYYEPANAAFAGAVHIARVTHGYRGPEEYAMRAFGSSGGCNNNTACTTLSAGWEYQIDSVVMLVAGGSGFCTGTLINNTAQDLSPYILTANHCYSNPSNWVFWFNWESPTCQNPGATPEYDSLSGAVLRARRADSDFCLVELNDAVPESFEPYWAGFDYTGVTPASTTGVHHPAGDIKKFSQDFDAPGISSYSGNNGSGSTHWRVADWDEGTTEGGSSGSALFDQNHRIIGQLHGGSAACGNDLQDYYGRLSVSWDGANSQQRLRDWLDPAGMDPGAIDGTTPTQYPNDASISAIISPLPDSNTCDADVVPVFVLRNAGTDPLTSVDIQYSINGAPPDEFGWTGALPGGATETVTMPAITLAPGVTTIEIRTVSPNGAADDNPANDLRSVTVTVLEAVGVPLPLAEDFEGAFPPASWINDNPDGQVSWQAGNVSGFGAGNGSAFYNNFDDDHRGTTDSLITPFLDLGPAPTTIEFDVAYARFNASLSDGMQVMMSEDCGQTWSEVWTKSGSDLSTAGEDVEDAFTPAATQWRTEVIDITDLANVATAQFAFVSVTGWGNNLYLDNIRINATEDADMDGYTAYGGDCNDGDPTVNPGVPEVHNDGIDNDCNPATADVPRGCSATGASSGSLGGMLLLLGLVLVGCRRRRWG